MHQMKIADLMKFSLDLLKFLSENEVKVDDWRFVACMSVLLRCGSKASSML